MSCRHRSIPGNRTRFLTLTLGTWLLACARNPVPEMPVGASCCTYGTTISDRLFFGRDIEGRDTVSDQQWSAFVTDVIAAEFPNEGWTLYRTEGFWNDSILSLTPEPTFVLERVHALTARTDSIMERIARAYVLRFRQAAVLRVQMPASVSLIRDP